MAWVTDPNFGSTLFAVPATSPFSTGGGNRMLNVWGGAGATYRNDVSFTNMVVSCQFFFRVDDQGSGRDVGGLVVRRKTSDGSFYGSVIRHELDSDQLYIFKYNGTLDTFTDFGVSYSLDTNPNFIPHNTIMNFELRIVENSLTASILHTSGTLAVSVGTVDSTITGAGNPGVCSNLRAISLGQNINGEMYFDNWSVSSL
jgi:hypothetical protein